MININILLAFAILAIAMYLVIKLLNIFLVRFNLLPKPDVIGPKSKTEIALETLDNVTLQSGDVPSINVHAFNEVGIEPETFSNQVITIAEGLVEGVQAIAESTGEALSAFMGGLFPH